MKLTLRLALIAAFTLGALAGCQRGSEETPSDPRPPAEQPPPPPAPDIPAPADEEAPSAEAEAEEPADAEEGETAVADAGISAEAQAEADQLWRTLCSTCHGMTGEGDGPVSAGFPVKPRSFSDQEWQQETTDEDIAKVIVEGGAAIGKSPLMPGNPNLTGKPEVVQALVKMVREMGNQ